MIIGKMCLWANIVSQVGDILNKISNLELQNVGSTARDPHALICLFTTEIKYFYDVLLKPTRIYSKNIILINFLVNQMVQNTHHWLRLITKYRSGTWFLTHRIVFVFKAAWSLNTNFSPVISRCSHFPCIHDGNRQKLSSGHVFWIMGLSVKISSLRGTSFTCVGLFESDAQLESLLKFSLISPL